MSVHAVAAQGFDTVSTSGVYDRARPSYPSASLDLILDAAAAAAGAGQPIKVVELGAGTGLSTRALLRRAAERGIKVGWYAAVDPSQGMREAWSATVPVSDAGAVDGPVQVFDGTFDTFPNTAAPPGGADAVLIAQAWHWVVEPAAAIRAIARALRPGGVWALLWNLEDRDGGNGAPPTPWVGELRDLYEKYEAGTPQYRLGKWKQGMLDAGPTLLEYFQQPTGELWAGEPHTVHTHRETTVNGVVDRVLSKSYIGILPKDEQEKLRANIHALFARPDTEIGRQSIGDGKFAYPYRTDLFLFYRR